MQSPYLGSLFFLRPRPLTRRLQPANGKSAVEDVINDPTKGLGAVKNVTLHSPLEQERVERGLAIYEMKCSACHKLDDKRVENAGKTSPREGNPRIYEHDHQCDVMLTKTRKPKTLELCLMRMPNQNMSIGMPVTLEFMRQNDGENDRPLT